MLRHVVSYKLVFRGYLLPPSSGYNIPCCSLYTYRSRTVYSVKLFTLNVLSTVNFLASRLGIMSATSLFCPHLPRVQFGESQSVLSCSEKNFCRYNKVLLKQIIEKFFYGTQSSVHFKCPPLLFYCPQSISVHTTVTVPGGHGLKSLKIRVRFAMHKVQDQIPRNISKYLEVLEPRYFTFLSIRY
jgi:hypothetical protein